MKKTVVVAIGGNAITLSGQAGTVEEQFDNVKKTCDQIIDMVELGYDVVLTHGNGPQVGNEVLKNEAGKAIAPAYSLDVCGSETQGSIGYIISQTLNNRLKKRGVRKDVISLITQTVVDKNDPAFQNPTKPIGPFYTKADADALAKEKGYTMIEDSGRGYRRVVPSPKPIAIIEKDSIHILCEHGFLVVCAGGGGIPVVLGEDGSLSGVEAVIDKDRGASLLAKGIGADCLLILTGVEQVAINFGKPDMQNLSELTVSQARAYLKQGQFPPGSMGPKIEAVCDFVEQAKPGAYAVITSIDKFADAMQGKTGTRIVAG